MKSENLFTESENTDSTFGTQYYIVNSGFHEKTESENIKVKSEKIFRAFGEKWKEFLRFWRKVKRKIRKSEKLDSLCAWNSVCASHAPGQWLVEHPELDDMQDGRKLQAFSLETFYHATQPWNSDALGYWLNYLVTRM